MEEGTKKYRKALALPTNLNVSTKNIRYKTKR